MSDAFRDLLRKVGSGPHTSKPLTRAEAEAATCMILRQEATPAQIGAFMIAHRIKRPTPEELAGMLDAYEQLGPKLMPLPTSQRVMVLGIPYDGRSRTAPVSPLVSLMLAACHHPVVLHGGRRMPTKEGVPLVELWQGLGVDWTGLTLDQVQQVLNDTGIGFVYLPQHFPLAEAIVPYREQIGKRPPFATLELFWNPYGGEAIVVPGYVHPPTEELAQQTFALRGTQDFITVKGLEGSCDLPRDRTCIIGVHHGAQAHLPTFERLLLHPRDYGFAGEEVPLISEAHLLEEMQLALKGQLTPLAQSAIWTGGFYLWQGGRCAELSAGLDLARELLVSGQVADQLANVSRTVAQHKPSSVRISS